MQPRDRELRGHFAVDPARHARTGGSTVRRSFAALLREPLGLRGVPRNFANPGHFSNYGLSEEHDTILTSWMHQHLALAVWASDGSPGHLKSVESDVIVQWAPPLNIAGNPRPTPGLTTARATMATEARTWPR